MKRRSLLGLLWRTAAAAAFAPPLEQLFVETAAEASTTLIGFAPGADAWSCLAELNAVLKDAYPAGCFAEAIEREAPFRRMLREPVFLSGCNAVIVDLHSPYDPYEDA